MPYLQLVKAFAWSFSNSSNWKWLFLDITVWNFFTLRSLSMANYGLEFLALFHV